MDPAGLATFALTEFLLCLTPGPAVLLVVGVSMRRGFALSHYATLGILATNVAYFTLSAVGVASLILASAALFTVLKYIGAAYLVWLGVQMIAPAIAMWRQGRVRAREGGAPAGEFGAALARLSKNQPAAERQGRARLFWKGVSLQASNPKNLAIFVAIIPQFIDPAGDVVAQMTVLGVISVALELPVLVAYALAFSALARVITDRAVLWLEAGAGGLLVMLGGALVWARRV